MSVIFVLAPRVGFEPTTISLHLSQCFYRGWTISLSFACAQDISVSSLYGASDGHRSSHGITRSNAKI